MYRRAFCKTLSLQFPFLSWLSSLEAREKKIGQAVCCLLDASESMRSGHDFFGLQKLAIATTLRHPCVTQRLLESEDGRNAFALIMWASANKQIFAIPWTVIHDDHDLRRVAKKIKKLVWPYRRLQHSQTGLGMALFAAVEYMSIPLVDRASRKIINISSNGKNNDGLEPQILRSRIFCESIAVNGIIMPGQAPTYSLEDLTAYYSQNVITDILVPVKAGPDAHRHFVDGMVSKFCAELV